MGKASRDKGGRTERAVVKLLQSYGQAAERVPLSGAAGGRYVRDVSVPVLGRDKILEVKCRKDGFKQIYEWLGSNYGLVIKADNKDLLVCLRLSDAAQILSIAESRHTRP